MRLLQAPGTDAERIIKKHGGCDINRESLGYESATKAASTPVFMHLNHVNADKEGHTESATDKGVESRPRSRLPSRCCHLRPFFWSYLRPPPLPAPPHPD